MGINIETTAGATRANDIIVTNNNVQFFNSEGIQIYNAYGDINGRVIISNNIN
jgi:hypothetical protein